MNWVRAREALIFLVIFVAGVLAALLIGWFLTQVQMVRNQRGTPQNYLAGGPDAARTIELARTNPFAITASGLVERASGRSVTPQGVPCPSVPFPGSSTLQCTYNTSDP